MLNVHLIVILVALLLGFVLYHMSKGSNDMTVAQRAAAERYCMYSYLFFGVAAGVAVYHYLLEGKSAHKKAKMCGMKRGYMCGAKHKY